MEETRVRRGSSWGSILGGWLAALGALAILFPITVVALGLSNPQLNANDPTVALPLVLALFVSYLIGGYVAGRLAGYRTAWHGLMSAVFGLFVAFLIGIVAGAGSYFGIAGALPRLEIGSVGDAVAFGAVLGFLAAILGGWLGGLLAPSRAYVTEPTVRSERVGERREERRDERRDERVVSEHPRVVDRPARRGGFLSRLTQPMAGSKGGEPDDTRRIEQERREERR
jgi:hypothetical protein